MLQSGIVTPQPHPEVVGMVELVDRLGVPRTTINTWRQRGQFPEPAWIVGGRPAWNFDDVQHWYDQRRTTER